jgi:hypothetical protein
MCFVVLLAPRSGSMRLHNLSFLKVDTAFLFSLVQIDTGPFFGINSFPFSVLQQLVLSKHCQW